jgi:hypothetical protein
MGRKLTFAQLKSEKGWPYGRQHTHKLVRDGHFPKPDKAYEGGLINVWDEDVVDAHLSDAASKTDGEAA